MEALRPKLVAHLESVLDDDSATKVAGQVLAIVRGHDDEYARSHPLVAEFTRRPVTVTLACDDSKARGELTTRSAVELVHAAVRKFGARNDSEPGAGVPRITEAQLADLLRGLYVDARDDETVFCGVISNPASVAGAVFRHLPANRAHEPEAAVGPVPHPAACADPEVAAVAALVPVLPMVSRLGHDGRERVMNWARARACDGLPPF